MDAIKMTTPELLKFLANLSSEQIIEIQKFLGPCEGSIALADALISLKDPFLGLTK